MLEPARRPYCAHGPKARTACPCLLCRIVVWDKANEREIVVLTNHLEFHATTIDAI